ncbi:outer membrane protein assembly factor BamB family protein [Haloarcula brevis]|uniref:outer membrane protein assembly factor BamB family protein n=1 Tax=Haloarcula brevis TaxID=3111453 RepID=UPI00300EA330
MNRRQLLTLLATAGTGGCLSFREAGEAEPATQTGFDTTVDSQDPQRATSTPSGYASTAASVETVQTLSMDITALSAAGPSYLVATLDEIQLRDFGSASPRNTLEAPVNSSVVELTDSDCYVGSQIAGGDRSTIYRFDTEGGTLQARTEIRGSVSKLTTAGDLLVCGTNRESTEGATQPGTHITVFDRASLDRQWTTAVGNGAITGDVCRLDDALHVGFTNFLVGFAVTDGTIRYRAPLNVGYPVAYQGDLVADVDRKLRRFDPETLAYDWSVGSEVAGRPVVVGEHVAVPTTDGLLCATVADGQQRWSRTLESVSGFTPELLVYQGGLLWYGTAAEELYGLVPPSGETAFSLSADLSVIAATTGGVVIDSGYETLELRVS